MARPKIVGTVIRRVELHCNAGSSNKDYVITLTGDAGGYRVFTEYGPHQRLNNGGEHTKSPVDLRMATAMVDQLSLEKIRKQYRVVSDDRPSQAAQAATKPAKQKQSAPAKEATPKLSIAQLAPATRAKLCGMF
jgi:hypothetical protein